MRVTQYSTEHLSRLSDKGSRQPGCDGNHAGKSASVKSQWLSLLPNISLRTDGTCQTTYLLPAIPAAQGPRPSGPPPLPQAGFLIAREALRTPQQHLSTCPPTSEGVSNCSPPPGLRHRPPHSRASGGGRTDGGRTDGGMRGHSDALVFVPGRPSSSPNPLSPADREAGLFVPPSPGGQKSKQAAPN